MTKYVEGTDLHGRVIILTKEGCQGVCIEDKEGYCWALIPRWDHERIGIFLQAARFTRQEFVDMFFGDPDFDVGESIPARYGKE